MKTNLSSPISDLAEREADITIVPYAPKAKPEGRFIRSLRPIMKWFGLLSTIAWGVAALSPETLRVPEPLQGWVFVISIIWFFAYCVGMFNL